MGDGVIGIDNMCPYYPVSIKESRVKVLNEQGIHVFCADINERNLLSHIIAEYKVTHILALGAQAGVRYAAKDPGSYINSNVHGFMQILEAARFAEPKPMIVYASSSSVYGLNTKTPFLRRGCCGSACKSVCCHEEEQRDDGLHIQPHLRLVHDRLKILHSVWAVGETRHGSLLVRQEDSGRRVGQHLPGSRRL